MLGIKLNKTDFSINDNILLKIFLSKADLDFFFTLRSYGESLGVREVEEVLVYKYI
jgi:hypothetical protein